MELQTPVFITGFDSAGMDPRSKAREEGGILGQSWPATWCMSG